MTLRLSSSAIEPLTPRDLALLTECSTERRNLQRLPANPGSPWTCHNIRTSRSETPSKPPSWVQEHSLSGLSAQVLKDTSTKHKEEAGEDEKVVDTINITTHTSQPGHQLGKKKKKGIIRNCSCPFLCPHHCPLSLAQKEETGLLLDKSLSLSFLIGLFTSSLSSLPFSGYIRHPVVPAKQAELMKVAKAIHREQFDAQMNHLFQWETDATLNALQTGLYIGWRCPHYLWDCFRIRDESKCFCGHLLKQHLIISDLSVPCIVSQCRCLMFCFIPSRPEDVGEFWLKRRATFNPKAWRAQCRCKHSHEDHAANGTHPCRHHGCSCNCFKCNFPCASCDRRWEEHKTSFENEEIQQPRGRSPDEKGTRNK
ncbi:LOW QUALITY PROTEIN: protein FAM221B [Ctenodactylus gundi]